MLISEVLQEEALLEFSKEEFLDFAHAFSSGITFGTRDNIAAWIRSKYGNKKYEEYLEHERQFTAKVKSRNKKEVILGLTVYDLVEIFGMLMLPIPWAQLAGTIGTTAAKIFSKYPSIARPAAKLANDPTTMKGKIAKGVADAGIQYGTYATVSTAAEESRKNTLVNAALEKNKSGDRKIAEIQFYLNVPITGIEDETSAKAITAAIVYLKKPDEYPFRVDDDIINYIKTNKEAYKK